MINIQDPADSDTEKAFRYVMSCALLTQDAIPFCLHVNPNYRKIEFLTSKGLCGDAGCDCELSPSCARPRPSRPHRCGRWRSHPADAQSSTWRLGSEPLSMLIEAGESQELERS